MTDEETMARGPSAPITDADHARLRQYLTARARMVFDGTTEPHTTLLLETFARHREAAMIEGARIALDAAAQAAWSIYDGRPTTYGQRQSRTAVEKAIRALDPTQLIKDATDAE